MRKRRKEWSEEKEGEKRETEVNERKRDVISCNGKERKWIAKKKRKEKDRERKKEERDRKRKREKRVRERQTEEKL